MKRAAESILTPQDLKSKDNQPQIKKNEVQTQKSQRTIFKVQGLAGEKKDLEDTKPKTQNKSQNIFGAGIYNLFGTSTNSSGSNNKTSVFNSNQSIFNKPSTGLFNTAGLFGNNSKNNGGLFSNTSTVNTPSIFSNTSTVSAPSIFSNISAAGSSLFSNTSTPGTSLFSNLFNNNSTSNNKPIFDFSKHTPEKRNDSEDEGGEQSQNQHKSEQKFNPAESTGKYVYKSPYEKKIEKKVLKYKKGNGELVENLDISIQQLIQNRDNKIVMVRLPATKNILYQGILIKKLSTIRNLHNKEQNVQMKLFTRDQKTNKLVPDLIKIQFDTKEDGKQFTQLFNKSNV